MPFTPSREVAASAAGAAEVAARTVGREEILTRLEQRLRSAATSRNRPHTLLVGPWGSGKTHLVEVALHRMRQNAAVADQLAVVRLPEDAIGVTRYQDLLDLAAGQLRGDPASSGPAAVAGATAAGLPRRPAEDVDALPAEPLAGGAGRAPATGGSVSEQDIRELLNGRVLLLVIDNLDRVFTAIGVRGQRQLRGWVETSGDVMLLTTSSALFAGVSDRSLPWFAGFAVEHLPALSPEQGAELLLELARPTGDDAMVDFLASRTGRARLRALATLSGGSPRFWALVANSATPELLVDFVPAVDAVMEAVAPYYQQRLLALGGNEQRIVTALATHRWAAAPVREIAVAAGLEQRVAASTLGRLVELGWVRAEKVPGTDQRTTWYRLRDPLVRYHFWHRGIVGNGCETALALLRDRVDADGDASEAQEDQVGAAVAAGQDDRPLRAGHGGKAWLAAAVAKAVDGSAEAHARLPTELLDVAGVWPREGAL